jgi:inositol phosphorylceramide synthase catalytic subunit
MASSTTPAERNADLPTRFGSLVDRIRSAPRCLLVGTAVGWAVYMLVMLLPGRVFTECSHSMVELPLQFLLGAIFLGLVVWSDGTRRFFTGMLPFILFMIVYDLMRIPQPLVRHLHVHVVEPYLFDKTLFGIREGGAVLTPNELFERHNWPLVDFVTGTAYIIYVYWSVLFAAYLAIWRRDEAGRRLLSRFAWTFLLMNVAGFATYYIYPAAPPWYVADYGLGPANMATRSSAAGAARWDALTGIPYFAGFYGRSSDVFGAIPSLHVAYPLITFLYGLELRKRWLDVASFTLFLLVSFAAVYLNHHYVLDVLLGVVYTLVAYGVDWMLERRKRERATAAGARIEAA